MSLLDELAQVRAEIKTWERTFRTENGRDPSRDDIKAVPEITLKYKLYKSLNKSKDLPASSTSSSQPSTQARPPARPPVRPLDKTPTSSTRSFFRSVSSISTSFSTPVADDMSNPFLETTPVLTKRGSARGKPATPVQDSGDNPFLSPSASFGGKKGTTSAASGSQSQSQSQQRTAQPSKPGRRGSRPYGPSVPDPSFPDPFASPSKPRQNSIAGPMRTPGKPRRSSEIPDAGTMPGQAVGETAGGFLFAPSPSRLKSLLEANSLSRSPSKSSPGAGPSAGRAVAVGITPRTKARKRLRGEEVDETPRRPKGRSGAFFSSDPVGRPDDLEEEEEEEEFGPTPKKPVDGGRKGGFKILFGADEDTDEEYEGRMGTGKKKVGGDEPGTGGVAKMFKKRKIEQEPPGGKDTGKSNARSDTNGKGKTNMVPMNGSQGAGPPVTPSKPALDIDQSPRSASQSTPLKGKKLALLAMLEKQDDDSPIDPEAAPDLNLSPDDKGRIQVEDDLVREIEWSDSDPEVEPDAPLDGSGMALDAAPRRRMTKVKIEPYRLDQQRRVAAAGGTVQARDLRNGGRQFERTASSASTGSRGKAKTVVRDPDEPEDEAGGDSDETDGLSRLTIRSPENDVLRKTMAYHERKAMAIFSTKAANDLRLKRKGIEIYAAGEGFEGQNEDGEADEYGREDEGSEGDDDWDSEPEGWKKVGLGVDDDW